MAIESAISYVHHTASPWFGCTEKSPGCTNCYARELTLNHRWAGWGDKAPRVRSKGFWKDVYNWDRKAKLSGERKRIFTSLMDWLDPMVPIEWLRDFLEVIQATPNLDWLLLTKRPELFFPRLKLVLERGIPSAMFPWLEWWVEGMEVPPNVWMGVTVEDQKRADERIPLLCKIPAKIRWLSVEPLLEKVNLGFERPLAAGGTTMPGPLAIHFVVVGGESGKNRRDCGIEAIIDVLHECQDNNVPIWVKQDSAYQAGQQGRLPAAIFNIKQLPN